jgi:hypothetical protein
MFIEVGCRHLSPYPRYILTVQSFPVSTQEPCVEPPIWAKVEPWKDGAGDALKSTPRRTSRLVIQWHNRLKNGFSLRQCCGLLQAC